MKNRFLHFTVRDVYFLVFPVKSYKRACVCTLSWFSPVQLCKPVDLSPPGSSVCGIFQARILEWVAISSSREPSRPMDQTHISCTAGRFFTTGKPQGYWGTIKLNNFVKGSQLQTGPAPSWPSSFTLVATQGRASEGFGSPLPGWGYATRGLKASGRQGAFCSKWTEDFKIVAAEH